MMHDPLYTSEKRMEMKAGPFWVWTVPALCLVILLIIQSGGLNRSLFLLLNGLAHVFPDKFWALLSLLGNGLIVFVVLAPWIHKKPVLIWSVLIASILFLIFGQSMKHLLDWPRPPAMLAADKFHLIGPVLKRNAFPSGHAAQIFILCGVFGLTTARRWLRVLLVFYASLVAISRVAVGAHWPQDVVAGALLGWVLAWVGLQLAEVTRWGWQDLGQKILGTLLLCACVVAGVADHSGYDVVTEQRFIAIVFFTWGLMEYLKIFGVDVLKRLKRA